MKDMDPRRIWFDPPHVRWGRVVATVLIASALVGLWVAQRRGLFDEPQNRVVVAAGAAASGVSPRGERNAVPEAAAMVAAAPPAKAASSVELVCGLGAVSFDPGDEKQLEALTDEANKKLLAHRKRVLPGWIEEMKSSTDEQVQAAGWLLEARDVWLGRTEWAQSPESTDALEELARVAQRSRDPLIYALAVQSCEIYRVRTTPAACRGLSVEEWAQRDPGNAFPWLFGMGGEGVDAQRRSLYAERALASETIRSSWGTSYSILAKAAPRDEAPLDRSVRFRESLSIDSYVSLVRSGVLEHCKDSELRQGARRQQCELLATFMTDKSESLMEAEFGNAIGRRLGWSADRLARLDKQRQALSEMTPKDADFAGCDGLARAEAYFADVSKYGERGALRRRQQAAR